MRHTAVLALPQDTGNPGATGESPGRGNKERHYLANQLLAAVQMYGSENVVSLERLQQ